MASKSTPAPQGPTHIRIEHTAVGRWSKGDVIALADLPASIDLDRLLALGAVAHINAPETEAPADDTASEGTA
jgi:hypothetical protein